MVIESLAVFVCTLLLALMGLGPALWLVRGEKRVQYACAAAPALGYALLVIVGFPLVRYVAPVRSWAWPVTLIWIAGSIVLVGLDWNKRRAEYRQQIHVAPVVAVVGLMLAVGLVLVSPLLLKGIQFAVFRSNSSDAFLYMSFAETMRVAPWSVILGGVAFGADNMTGLQHLAAVAPAALFTARFLDYPLIINKMAVMAWAAEMTRIPTVRLYYAQSLVAYLLTVPLVLAIGEKLRLPRVLTFLAAGAIAVGYWARFVLETDAGYEISVIPVILLFVLAWMLMVEAAGQSLVRREQVLLGLAGAAVVVSYSPSIVLCLLAVVSFELLVLIQSGPRPKAWRDYIAAGCVVLAALAFTGQLDFIVRGTLSVISRAAGEAQNEPLVIEALKRDGLAGLWGLSGPLIATHGPGYFRWFTQQAFQALGVGLTGVALLSGLLNLRRSASRPARIVFCLVGAGFILAAVSFALHNQRTAGKAISYIYPYLALSAVLFAPQVELVFQPAFKQLSLFVLGAWLALQTGLGLFLPYLPILPGEAQNVSRGYWSYDVGPITSYLDAHPPQRLVVYVPRDSTLPNDEGWVMAGYTMFAFANYPVYFQSGVVADNNTIRPNVWLPPLTQQPDYAVILKAADYLGPEQLGDLVAETKDLALYHLKTDSLASLNRHEQAFLSSEPSLH